MAAVVFAAPSAQAAAYVLRANDGLNASSFPNPMIGSFGNWAETVGGTAVGAPTAGNTYGVTLLLRGPANGTSYTFQGDSLSINSGGRFLGKATGNTQILTVNDLILNGGVLDQANANNTTGVILTIGGNITVNAASGLGAIGGTANGSASFEILNITAPISGSAGLTVSGSTVNGGNATGVVRLSAANTYSGTLTVANNNVIASAVNRLLQLNNLNALSNATLTLSSTTVGNGVSFASTVNSGPFNVGALAGAANQTLADTAGSSITLSVGGNDASTSYSGILSGVGALTKVGSGTLTLSGANSYSGNTTISAGTLALGTGGSINSSANIIVSGGATFDVSAITYTLAAGQTLSGTGTVNGNVATASGTANIAPGASAGTLTFNNNLDLGGGGSATFELSTDSTTGNDQIAVTGNLTLSSSSTIRISALSGSDDLDTTGDYVLFAVAGTTTMASTPALVWEGTTPANYLNYTLVQDGDNVVLRYTEATAPTVSASATPSTATRNQAVLITAEVTPGSGNIASVTVDLTQIGGSASAALVPDSGNVYTNTFTVAASVALGGKTLAVTVTDDTTPTALTGTDVIALTVAAANQIWDGGSLADNNWSSNPNWTGDTGPGLSGDSVTFAGTERLTPNLDANYSVTSLTFDNTAGSFAIGTDNSSALTLSGGVTNNSANSQAINVPVTMSGAQTIEAAAGNITLGSSLNNGGSSLTVAGANDTTLAGNVPNVGALTKNGGGTLTLSGTNAIGGVVNLNAGALSLTGGVTTHGANANPNLFIGSVGARGTMLLAGSSTWTSTTAEAFARIGTGANGIGVVSNAAGSTLVLGGRGGGLGVSSTNSSGVLYNDGTFSEPGGNANNGFFVGNYSGAYGYFRNSGTTTVNGKFVVGIGNAGTLAFGATGVLDVNDGTVTVNGISTGAATGINTSGQNHSSASGNAGVNVTGGTLTYPTNLTVQINSGNNLYSSINVTGSGKIITPNAAGFNLNATSDAANTTTVTLAGGGELEVALLNNTGSAASTGILTFNGGTLKAAAADATGLIRSGVTTYVQAGGATIDANGFDVKVESALLAPVADGGTTFGVTSITLGGTTSGYIGAPVVKIFGGGGQGAAAIANFDPATGTITGVTVTSPGSGYTSAPTVELWGGGGVVGAGAGIATATATANLGAVASGGLTKTGAGTLYLNGVNTYTGTTVVSAGTLGGNGTIAGALTVGASGTLAAGTSIGTFTVGGAATIDGTVVAEIASGPSADLVSFAGGATFNAGSTLTVVKSGNLANGETFNLFDGAISGSFTTLNLPGGPSHWDTSALYTSGEITLINTAPAAADFDLGVVQGGSATVTVTNKYASDTDGDSLVVVAITQGANGVVTFSGASITYTNTAIAASDSFTYTVSDGLTTTTATVTAMITSPEGFNKLSGPTPVGDGQYQLDYLGIPGQQYALDEAASVTPPITWTAIVTNTAANNGALSFTITPSNPSGFFRTRHVP